VKPALVIRAASPPALRLALLYPCAAALDDKDQNNNCQYGCDNLNNRWIHGYSSFLPQNACALPGLSEIRTTPGARLAISYPAIRRPNGRVRACSPPPQYKSSCYLTRVRRRWIKRISTTMARTAATT
jgi:hypothetical protein